jgi:acyl carrier protein
VLEVIETTKDRAGIKTTAPTQKIAGAPRLSKKDEAEARRKAEADEAEMFAQLKDIEPDLSFRKLALSAAEFMEIVFVLETQNHITLPDLDLLQVKTVGHLVLLTEQSLTTMSVKA